MAAHNELGELGEGLAVEMLGRKGYDILERNWVFGKEEIDIIAIHEGVLVIVEVKTRNSDYFGPPEQAVSKAKQNHLIRAANAYVRKYDLDFEVRFDVVGVILNAKEERLNHIEGAFQPSW
jgi:putative endonuclease